MNFLVDFVTNELGQQMKCKPNLEDWHYECEIQYPNGIIIIDMREKENDFFKLDFEENVLNDLQNITFNCSYHCERNKQSLVWQFDDFLIILFFFFF